MADMALERSQACAEKGTLRPNKTMLSILLLKRSISKRLELFEISLHTSILLSSHSRFGGTALSFFGGPFSAKIEGKTRVEELEQVP